MTDATVPPSRAAMRDWLDATALPLWAGVGIDAATGTAWEALDHAGLPMRDLDRRLRVQARQAFVFARSADPSHQALAVRLFRFVMDRGFDPATGNLAAGLTPRAEIRDAPHDLYDLSFVLLAASALAEMGADIDADLHRLEVALARLKAPRGWHETAAARLPRRQNPHMHLFEAMTELYRVTGAPRIRAHAQEVLDLLADTFLQPDGRILEYFDASWTALPPGAQAIEPGHMAEWIFLLDAYEAATGSPCGVDLHRLWQAVLDRRDTSGLLPDRSDPDCGTRRLWPQTELLKAAIVMRERGDEGVKGTDPDTVLRLLRTGYLDGPAPGGWYDCRDAHGTLLSDQMPASTLYHVEVALRALDR